MSFLRHFHPTLRLAGCAAIALAIAAPPLCAQNQIVLGDSTQEFQLQAVSSSTLQLNLGNCPAGQCVLGSGGAYGDGVFASSNGTYALTTSSSNHITLEVTSDDSGSSFAVSQSEPLQLQYSSPQGTLSGTLSLASLDQGNDSTTASLSGELEITGGSLAGGLASSSGSANLLIPVGPSLADVLAQHTATTVQIGYPSTLTLSPASASACPVCRDFVTGGGWIVGPDGAKANFGVHGGIRNGGFWGHLEYNDHSSAPPMTVRSVDITNYVVISPDTREIDGTAEVNGQAGYSFQVIVSDNDNGGEGPGPNHADTFSLSVSNGYTASGHLGGGDIEIHKGSCKNLEGTGQQESKNH
jgi:hypothetical protein